HLPCYHWPYRRTRHVRSRGAKEAHLGRCIMPSKRSKPLTDEQVAGNGLLHRRMFLAGGAALAGAMTGYAANDAADAAPLPVEPWMKIPTPDGFDPYGKPSRFESKVVREPRPPTAG